MREREREREVHIGGSCSECHGDDGEENHNQSKDTMAIPEVTLVCQIKFHVKTNINVKLHSFSLLPLKVITNLTISSKQKEKNTQRKEKNLRTQLSGEDQNDHEGDRHEEECGDLDGHMKGEPKIPQLPPEGRKGHTWTSRGRTSKKKNTNRER